MGAFLMKYIMHIEMGKNNTKNPRLFWLYFLQIDHISDSFWPTVQKLNKCWPVVLPPQRHEVFLLVSLGGMRKAAE